MKFYFVLLTTFILLSFSFSKSLMAGEERLLILVGKLAQMISDHVSADGAVQCKQREFKESSSYMECRMLVMKTDIFISDNRISFMGEAAEKLYKSLTFPEYPEVDTPNSAYNHPPMKANHFHLSEATAVVFKKETGRCACLGENCAVSFSGWIKVEQPDQWIILMPLTP